MRTVMSDVLFIILINKLIPSFFSIFLSLSPAESAAGPTIFFLTLY